jgi:hypothetical protein
MRRTIALALTMLFSWMLIAPVLPSDTDASLPACCRRYGEHHCMMRGTGRQIGSQRGFTTVTAKCPCSPAIACGVHSPNYKPEAAATFYAEAVFHPARAPQTEARFRISSLRSHQKRGPPIPLA